MWFALVWCGVAAVWIDLGTLHRLHHGDSLLPILISLYGWTPFWWEQDRLGMLIPLLARPFPQPLANLLVQDALTVFGALMAMVLLARYLLRERPWPAVALVSATVFLALCPPNYRFETLVTQPYGVSLALGLGGLWMAESLDARFRPLWRFTAALVIVVLAHWVNVATSLFLVPLVLFGSLAGLGPCQDRARPRRTVDAETSRLVLLLALGMAAGWALTRLVAHASLQADFMPPSAWQNAWVALARETWKALAPQRALVVLAVVAAAGACSLLAPSVRRQGRAGVLAAGVLAATGIVYGLVVGTSGWLRYNDFNFRYLIPSVLALQTALAVLAVTPFLADSRKAVGTVGLVVLGPALLAAAAYSYGVPSLQNVRGDLDRALGSRTADVLASRATHVAGGYWEVWPTVFHANLVLRERGEKKIIWGISARSGPTRHRWSKVSPQRLRIAVPANDTAADVYLKEYGFPPLVIVEHRPTITLLRPSAPRP